MIIVNATSPSIIVTDNAAISASVVAALRDFGFVNAGTPLEIASTPVSAAEPEENPRASRNTSANPDRAVFGLQLVVGARGPHLRHRRPTAPDR